MQKILQAQFRINELEGQMLGVFSRTIIWSTATALFSSLYKIKYVKKKTKNYINNNIILSVRKLVPYAVK